MPMPLEILRRTLQAENVSGMLSWEMKKFATVSLYDLASDDLLSTKSP